MAVIGFKRITRVQPHELDSLSSSTTAVLVVCDPSTYTFVRQRCCPVRPTRVYDDTSNLRAFDGSPFDWKNDPGSARRRWLADHLLIG